MKTIYIECQSLYHARLSREILSWPHFKLVTAVYDSLDIAIRSLTPMAQVKRQSVVARYHCPNSHKLRFLLLAKIP